MRASRILLGLLAIGVSGCLTPATLARARGQDLIAVTRPELAGIERAVLTESGMLRICARADVKIRAGKDLYKETEKAMFWLDVPLGKLRPLADRKVLEPSRTGGFDSRADVSNSFGLKYVVRQRKFKEGCPDVEPPAAAKSADGADPKAAGDAKAAADGKSDAAKPAASQPASPPEPSQPVAIAEIDRATYQQYRELAPQGEGPGTVYFAPLADGGGSLVYVSRDPLWQGPFELLGRPQGAEERRHLELVLKLDTGTKHVSIPGDARYYLALPFAAVGDVLFSAFYLLLLLRG